MAKHPEGEEIMAMMPGPMLVLSKLKTHLRARLEHTNLVTLVKWRLKASLFGL